MLSIRLHSCVPRGRTWHMVIPNWEVNCRIGRNIFYNETKIKEALEPEMKYNGYVN